jgi:hypothetical protein
MIGETRLRAETCAREFDHKHRVRASQFLVKLRMKAGTDTPQPPQRVLIKPLCPATNLGESILSNLKHMNWGLTTHQDLPKKKKSSSLAILDPNMH